MQQYRNELEAELEVLRDDATFQGAVQHIEPGYFKRDPTDPRYAARLHYTKVLRQFLFDCKAMNEISSNNELKKLFFDVFGYKGNLDFTFYPNIWLRDLPMLDIGKGVYLADGMLLGTNQVSRDQRFVKVGRIKIGDRTLFDQRCAIGLDTSIGEDCIIGIGCMIGLWTCIGNRTILEANVSVGHRVKIGSDVVLKENVVVHSGSIIEDGVTLVDDTTVPRHFRVTKESMLPLKAKGKTQARL